ncbi:MAG TPA: tRNA (adenosine(37)-N6)-threonylcarbamoyltransferase complex dimerization subunit type 1 TsaB [Patescibacteria group bacterium]|nr:tRNA (adenosine(37)-N6)-threonylcarbamoyltransferase complex dimerization subunit type 1 TsaB [Patescibacteria group bacterium]
MLILTIRSERPEAEIGLFDGHTQLAYETWQANRELAATIHQKIRDILQSQGKQLQDVQGIVCFAGPGSFTGLRIGITVGNVLAYGLGVPVLATTDPDWLHQGVERLEKGDSDKIALPHYGAPVHITTQKK